MAFSNCASLERVGEWWSILIIRDALLGFTRFDEFQKSLNIAPNMLTRRLSALRDAGLLQRRRYSKRPPRYEYILTEMGRDFRPVIVAMFAWGNRHFAPEGESVLLVNKKTQARGLQRFEHSLMLNGLNVLNVWNYLNAQVDAEGNQKQTVSD